MNQFKSTYSKFKYILNPIIIIYACLVVILIALFIREYIAPQIVTPPVAKIDHFANLQLKAKAVYVFDEKENKVLFEKNSHSPLPLASITKLMSLHCSLQHLDKESYVEVPDRVYAFNDGATSTGAFEEWKTRDLAIYTLITSSNTGAETLAKYAGGEDKVIDCMNTEALKLDLFDTKFDSVTGLDIDIGAGIAGAYGSAENVVTMLRNIYINDTDIISKTVFPDYEIKSKNGRIHKAVNTNIVAQKMTGFLASKTGLTDLAGGNITYIMDAGLNHKIFVALLGSTEDERFTDALIINDAVIKSFLN
ncbi:MAG: serine hydrolase [Patescibacteria group bacterium]